MTAFAVVIALALVALVLRGFVATAAIVATAVGLIGLTLDATYVARRRKDRLLDHRHHLDQVVRAQYLGLGIVVAGAAIAIGRLTSSPLDHAANPIQALIVGVAIAGPTIYVSSLIDWYWVMPKVSGMTGTAPCERAERSTIRGVTKIWLFHRAAATAVVTAVLAGVPGYLASYASASGAESAGW